jgi:hypothetical protein
MSSFLLDFGFENRASFMKNKFMSQLSSKQLANIPNKVFLLPESIIIIPA